MGSPYTLENEVFRTYGFYAILMAFKMLAVVFLITHYRFSKKVLTSSENKRVKCFMRVPTDEDTERAKRIHQNDMENIIPFWIIGLMYISTNPSLSTATFCYRTFAVARFVHSLVYVFAVPQPCRALAFTGGIIINVFMACQVLYINAY